MNSSTAVEATSADLSAPDAAAEAVTLLAVVADPVRWRLLAALAAAGSRCVCELQPVGGVAPNLLSYHLRVLREAGLVTATRRGRWIDYALADGALDRLHAALPAADRRQPGYGQRLRLSPLEGQTMATPVTDAVELRGAPTRDCTRRRPRSGAASHRRASH